MKKSIEEAVRELLRVVILAVVPVAIVSISSGTLDIKAIGIAASVAFLRGVEKFLHEEDSKVQLPL